MSMDDLSIRLSVKDAEAVKAVLREVGAKGGEALAVIETASDKATVSSRAFERQLRQVKESIDPAVRAQRELAASKEVLDEALKRGMAADEHARLLQLLEARYTDLGRSAISAAEAVAQAARVAGQSQQTLNALLGVKVQPELSAEAQRQYEALWTGLLARRDEMIALAQRDSQRAVNALLGVQALPEVSKEVRRDYEAFWSGVVATQGQAETKARTAGQRTVNALLGVREFPELSKEVRQDYEALWGSLLEEQERVQGESKRLGDVSAGQMSMARMIVMRNIQDIGNVAIATRGNIASMLAPVPDLVYGFRLMGGSVATFATGAAIGLGVVGATLGVVVARAVALNGEVRRLSAQMALFNNPATSAAGLQDLAHRMNAAGPFGRGEASETVAGLLSYRQFSGDVMGQLGTVAVSYAMATRKELAPAAEELAAALSRGYAGVRQLDEAYNFLSASQRQQIRVMYEHGQTADAARVTLEALGKHMKAAAEIGETDLDRALRQLANSWNELVDAVASNPTTLQALKLLSESAQGWAHIVSGGARAPSQAQQYQDAQDRYQRAAGRVNDIRGMGTLEATLAFGYGDGRRNLALRDAEAELDAARAALQQAQAKLLDSAALDALLRAAGPSYRSAQEMGLAEGMAISADRKAAQDIRTTSGQDLAILALPSSQRDEARARLAAERAADGKQPIERQAMIDAAVSGVRAEREATFGDAAKAAEQQTRAVLAQAEAYGKLGDELVAAEKAAKVEAEVMKWGEAYRPRIVAQVEQEYAARRRLAEAQADLAVQASERTASAAGLGAAAEREAAADNAVAAALDKTIERRKQDGIEAAKQLEVSNRTVRALDGEAEALNRRAAALQQGTAAMRGVERDEFLRGQRRQYAPDGQGLTPDQQAKLDSDMAAWDRRQVANDNYQGSAIRASLDAEIAGSARLAAALGQGTRAYEEQAQALQILNRFKQAGIDETDPRVIEYAEATARALVAQRRETERLQAAWGELESFGTQAFDRIGQAVTQMVVEGKADALSFQNLWLAVVSEIQQEFLKLALLNPLKNAIFGGNAPTITDVGGLLGGLLGGGGSSIIGNNLGLMASQGIGPATLLSAFEKGGVMTSRGPLPLHMYAMGGIADRPQVAVFGEGRRPEAYVPLPDGRSIPVTMSGGGAGLVVQVYDQRGAKAPPVRTEESRGPNGEKVLKLMIHDAVDDYFASGRGDRAINRNYGLTRAPVLRG